MTTAQLAAFDQFQATHVAFVTSYKTDQRPAAMVASTAAELVFIAAMPGAEVWVKCDYVPAGLVLSQVSAAHQRGDVSTEHDFATWGNFCPATYSVDLAHLFFAEAEALHEYACSLD